MTINIIRQGGGVQVIRSPGGPMGPQNVIFGMYIAGSTIALELLIRVELTQAMGASLELSAASAEANTAVIDQVFAMTIDGDVVGTVTFPAGETDAIVAFVDPAWAPGVFKLTAPSVTDPGLSGISVTIGGTKT